MTSDEMPKYKCHKQVWALKIREVAQGVAPAEHTGGSWLLVPENDRYAAIEVAHDWYAHHKPEAGGYYVVYSDGYSSYSPADAFESGYHPIDQHLAEQDPVPAPAAERIESLLAGPTVVGVDLAKEQDRCVRVFLEKGSVVKVEGIPLKLDHDAVVRVHPANVPLIFPPRTARPAESGE
ncbi:MAG: hypothetical protein L0G82_10635 [Pseudomonas sp.]|nr:hypothetical protein [Pseudomonas sp.]